MTTAKSGSRRAPGRQQPELGPAAGRGAVGRAASRQILACACVALLCLLWASAGIAPWWVGNVPGADLIAGPLGWWTDARTRVAGRRILLEGGVADYARAEALLRRSLEVRPLYAPSWLARGQLAWRRDRRGAAAAYTQLSMGLWPRRERNLWNVAMVAAEMGDRERAFSALRAYLQLTATGIGQAGWFARRLETDPQQRAVLWLPPGEAASKVDRDYSAKLLHIAVRNRDPELARRVWEAQSALERNDRKVAALYTDALLLSGSVEEAVAVWTHYVRGGQNKPLLSNGGFEQQPVQGGLGWRVREHPRLRWARDRLVRYQGQRSLRLTFAGLENAHYQYASQTIAVTPNCDYRLSGYWRGEAITTASGAYLQARLRGTKARLLGAGPARAGSWPWEPFSFDFRVPPEARLVEIGIRRDRARKAEPPFAGRLWLDQLALDVSGDEGRCRG